MRVLLDECIPRKLRNHLRNHEIKTVPEAGWSGRKNGELLILANGIFDAFVTIDKGLSYQQNLSRLNLIIISLASNTNRLENLLPLVPELLDVLSRSTPGSGAHIRIPSQ